MLKSLAFAFFLGALASGAATAQGIVDQSGFAFSMVHNGLPYLRAGQQLQAVQTLITGLQGQWFSAQLLGTGPTPASDAGLAQNCQSSPGAVERITAVSPYSFRMANGVFQDRFDYIGGNDFQRSIPPETLINDMLFSKTDVTIRQALTARTLTGTVQVLHPSSDTMVVISKNQVEIFLRCPGS